MPESLSIALQELAKASPYAVISIIIMWLCNHYNAKQWKNQKELSSESLKEIKSAYGEATKAAIDLYNSYTERQDKQASRYEASHNGKK